jgi:SOS-response transcriptional repressor LexA
VAVQAGNPKSIGSAQTELVDLNTFFVQGSAAMLQVNGCSMEDVGIHEGDYIIVSRETQPKNGNIVVVRLNGDEYTVKRWRVKQRRLYLVPANRNMEPHEIKEGDNFEVAGVVKYVIRKTD